MSKLKSKLVVLSLGLALLTACDNMNRSPQKSAKKTNDTTVGDVVDYGTGKTPLEIKKKKTEMLEKLNSDRNKTLEKAAK